MCFSDSEGETKGISLEGHGASEAEDVAEDADLKSIPFFPSLYIISFHLSRNATFVLHF